MTAAKTIKRIESITWILIFGGLFLIVFALVLKPAGTWAPWPMGVVGGLMTLAGAVLVWVRSRLTEDS